MLWKYLIRFCVKDAFDNEIDAAYAADYHNVLRFGLGIKEFPTIY
jgi:hypothetical protein